MAIKAVFFDLDGTLADTAPDLHIAMDRLLAEEGHPAVPFSRFRTTISGGVPAMFLESLGITPTHETYPRLRLLFLDHYEAAPCAKTCLFPGIPELLDALEAQGILWGIVTNKIERFSHPVTTALGLFSRAVCLVSGDSIPRMKPAPDGLLHACRLAGVAPEETLYVGDDLRDVEAAQAAGIPVVVVQWGCGSNVDTWGADAIIAQPLELLAHLKS
ncbi:MAG: phosphoglycolate phosphatase [Rhodocyclaceae bacterium]|nr:phosphoglycolate phosphatase [Rhodocyclaceae bacterium]